MRARSCAAQWGATSEGCGGRRVDRRSGRASPAAVARAERAAPASADSAGPAIRLVPAPSSGIDQLPHPVQQLVFREWLGERLIGTEHPRVGERAFGTERRAARHGENTCVGELRAQLLYRFDAVL